MSIYDDLLVGNNTNFTPSNIGKGILQTAASAVQNFTGVNPASFFKNGGLSNIYATTPFKNLYKPPGVTHSDFRARLGNNIGASILLSRKDGLSAALNISPRATYYAIASASPLGAYGVFNLNAPGRRGFGWGSHGEPAGLFKSDFTIQSNVVTKWSTALGTWVTKQRNAVTPFRGDRVNVIDYSKRTLKQAYKWRTPLIPLPALGGMDPNTTQDFIKFYFTGPDLHNGSVGEDDIMVFRATITSLDDSFNPEWSAVKMVGRADSNFHYGGYSRDMSLSFTIYATDRDELKPIYRKLNALAGYTAPIYNAGSIGLVGPWMRVTIGDLLVQQPVILDSLQLQLVDGDTPWEINLENDPEMKQVPLKIGVTMQLKVITDYLPQKNGNFYTLSKNNIALGPVKGTHNWLTDTTNTTQMYVDENITPTDTLKAKLKAAFSLTEF